MARTLTRQPSKKALASNRPPVRPQYAGLRPKPMQLNLRPSTPTRRTRSTSARSSSQRSNASDGSRSSLEPDTSAPPKKSGLYTLLQIQQFEGPPAYYYAQSCSDDGTATSTSSQSDDHEMDDETSGSDSTETETDGSESGTTDTDDSRTVTGGDSEGSVTPKPRCIPLKDDSDASSECSDRTIKGPPEVAIATEEDEASEDVSSQDSYNGISGCRVYDTESQMNEWLGGSQSSSASESTVRPSPIFQGCPLCQDLISQCLQTQFTQSVPEELRTRHTMEYCPIRLRHMAVAQPTDDGHHCDGTIWSDDSLPQNSLQDDEGLDMSDLFDSDKYYSEPC